MKLPVVLKSGLLLLPLAVLVAVTLMLAWGHQTSNSAEAARRYVPTNTEDPGPTSGPCNDGMDNAGDGFADANDPDCLVDSADFSIEIAGQSTKPQNPGQMTPGVGCSTKNAPTGDNCSVAVGARFTVNVNINKLNLSDLDGDGKAGYNGFQAYLQTSIGLNIHQRPCDEQPPLDNDSDFFFNDGCPAVGPDVNSDTSPDPESDGTPDGGPNCQPPDADDDDGDGFINDGCPAAPPPRVAIPAFPGPGTTGAETGAQCLSNKLDDDGDTFIDDGCSVATSGEDDVFLNCVNGVDDDGDGATNDGCTGGAGPEDAASEVKGVWPDCGFAAENKPSPNDYSGGCATGTGANESVFEQGTVMAVTYSCKTEGKQTITMIHGVPLFSHILDEMGGAVLSDGSGSTETIVVDCQKPPNTINIRAEDVKTGALLPGACFDIRDNTQQVLFGNVCDTDGDGLVSIPGVPNLAVSVVGKNAPQKYNPATVAKQPCDFTNSPGGEKCSLVFQYNVASGDLVATLENNDSGDPVPNWCVTIEDATNTTVLKKTCDGGVGDDDGAANGTIVQNLALGDYSIFFDVTNPGNVAAIGALAFDDKGGTQPAKQPCTLAANPVPARTCTAAFSVHSLTPLNLKLPRLSNLFLTQQGAKLAPRTCAESTDAAVFDHELSTKPGSRNKYNELQEVAAFEMEVRFDNKWVCVNLEPGFYFQGLAALGLDVTCFVLDKDSSMLEGIARIGCVTKGKDILTLPNPTGTYVRGDKSLGDVNLHLARITVRPQPEAFQFIKPGQDNGITVQILNQGCELADQQGEPIDKGQTCDDSDLTLRALEGDVVQDCRVDVLDQQQLAARWLTVVGNGLFNDRMDLEPTGQGGGQGNGDGDIDIKDIQFVFGRHGSFCTHQNRFNLKGPIWPPQEPRQLK